MRCFDRKMYFMIEMFHEKHDAKRVAFRNVFVEYRREYVSVVRRTYYNELQLEVNILGWEYIMSKS